jgi:hypothetical protein
MFIRSDIRLVLLAFAKRLAGDQADAPAPVTNGTVEHAVTIGASLIKSRGSPML